MCSLVCVLALGLNVPSPTKAQMGQNFRSGGEDLSYKYRSSQRQRYLAVRHGKVWGLHLSGDTSGERKFVPFGARCNAPSPAENLHVVWESVGTAPSRGHFSQTKVCPIWRARKHLHVTWESVGNTPSRGHFSETKVCPMWRRRKPPSPEES